MSTPKNPIHETTSAERVPDPCVIVIFGASGDLTKRKLMPALFKLSQNGLIPTGFSVIGISRAPETHDQFRETMRQAVEAFGGSPVKDEAWQIFGKNLFYLTADADDPGLYPKLSDLLNQLDQNYGRSRNHLYYLAVSPQLCPLIIEQLGQAGLSRPKSEENWTHTIIEKPFGRDLKSASMLNTLINKYFDEAQVYRIDHYLGKETVQNILVFRFANSIFEPIWNNHYIDHVEITVAETLGIENRGGYYDQAGALRDIAQNHLLQLVCTTAMEPPVAFTADAVRDEKAKVLEAVRLMQPSEVERYTVRGQYSDGVVEGKQVPAYRHEKNVAPDSKTETYVALKLFIDNWRWAGVPFYLRTGKRLRDRVTEIAICFKRTPHLIFSRRPEDQVHPNLLVLGIQPDESISIRFEAKQPGPSIEMLPVQMSFHYETSFTKPTEEAYERLLLDAFLGDATLFARADWIELAWGIVTPILDGWTRSSSAVPVYAAGTWGPVEADLLLAEDKRKWRQPQG